MKTTYHYIQFIFFVTFFITYGHSQTTIQGQNTIGGLNTEFIKSSTVLNNGEMVIGGWSFSGLSGDKTEINNGLSDFWIVNITPSLSINWQKDLGGDSTDALNVLYSTSDGGFICGGNSSSSISGNKTAGKIGRFDYWVVKLNSVGNIEWQNTYGGTQIDNLIDIVELGNGDLILAGSSDSGVSGNKTEASRGFMDYWIVKINSAGTVLWDKTLGGDMPENLGGVTVDYNGNIYLSGTSMSGVSGEKTETSYGINDIWLVKLDSNGNLIWDKTIGGNLNESLGDIIINGNYLYTLAGSGSGISGTKTESCIGQTDYWVTKMDFDGNIIWDQTIGGDWYDLPASILATNDDQILISGYSWSDISGDKTELSNGSYDMWPVSIDTLGNTLWEKTIGGSGWDELISIIEVADNDYVLIGDSDSNISGDKTENSQGQEDYWIVRISSTLKIDDLELQPFSLYPNPTSDNVSVQFENYQDGINLSIFSIEGNQIENIEMNANKINVNVSDYSPGAYFIDARCKGSFIGRAKFFVQ